MNLLKNTIDYREAWVQSVYSTELEVTIYYIRYPCDPIENLDVRAFYVPKVVSILHSIGPVMLTSGAHFT